MANDPAERREYFEVSFFKEVALKDVRNKRSGKLRAANSKSNADRVNEKNDNVKEKSTTRREATPRMQRNLNSLPRTAQVSKNSAEPICIYTDSVHALNYSDGEPHVLRK